MDFLFRRTLALLFGLAVLVPFKDCFGVDAQTNKIGTSAQTADSDGDGLSDAEDAHPYVANIQGVSWSIGTLTVGWSVDSSITQLETTLSQSEQAMIKQSELRFGTGIAGNTEAAVVVRSKLSGDPLKLFGLRDSGAEMQFQAKFAATGDMNWTKSDQNKATSLKSLVEQTQVASKLSGLNLEFTVQFYNYGDTDFIGRNLQVPIKAGADVVTIAQPYGANAPEIEIRIPAKRDRAIPIRFRAMLDTTQSLALLKIMEEKPPTISIEETQGAITSMIDGKEVDAISALVQMERKTCKLTVDTGSSQFTWRVAKRNEQTGKALQLADVFAALNALAKERAGSSANLFHYTNNYLRSALGHDCSLEPVRWWQMKLDGREDLDVAPFAEFDEEVHLSFRDGFPKSMQRWSSMNAPDDWSFSVWAHLLISGSGGLPQDPKMALGFWKKASSDGYALRKLGDVYAFGLYGLAQDQNLAVENWQKAVFAQNYIALLRLGIHYLGDSRGSAEGGLNTPYEKEKAREVWIKLRNAGDAHGFTLLGDTYLDKNLSLPEVDEMAVTLWKKAADEGNSAAVNLLGLAHSKGLGGLPVNEDSAFEFLKKSANAGNPNALRRLGFIYYNGLGDRNADPRSPIDLFDEANKRKSSEQEKQWLKVFKEHPNE